MKRAERGLTLLEVLAAVALLGLVYTALASNATQGVMSESDSFRRFEASLLADKALTQLELELAGGGGPTLGSQQDVSEDGLFTIDVEVTAWSPPAPPADVPVNAQVPDLIGGGSNGQEGILRRIRVRVSWQDVMGERSIERVTFGLDSELLKTLAPEADEGSGA